MSDDQLTRLAMRHNTELLIKFSLRHGIKPGSPFSVVVATVSAKVFVPSTGKILGSAEKSAKQIAQSNNNFALEEALLKASAKAAEVTGD